MIDDPRAIELLMGRIRAALPMRARVGRDVLRTLRQEAPEASLSHQCDVTEVRYAGDEGGREVQRKFEASLVVLPSPSSAKRNMP